MLILRILLRIQAKAVLRIRRTDSYGYATLPYPDSGVVKKGLLAHRYFQPVQSNKQFSSPVHRNNRINCTIQTLRFSSWEPVCTKYTACDSLQLSIPNVTFSRRLSGSCSRIQPNVSFLTFCLSNFSFEEGGAREARGVGEAKTFYPPLIERLIRHHRLSIFSYLQYSLGLSTFGYVPKLRRHYPRAPPQSSFALSLHPP